MSSEAAFTVPLTVRFVCVHWPDWMVERTQRLDVRMTPEEMSMLEQLAEWSGLTMADIVRTLVRKEHADRKRAKP